MRTESEIRADQMTAFEALRTAIETLPDAQVAPFRQRTKDLGDELSACLSNGAVPCSNPVARLNEETQESEVVPCGRQPMGMLKTPAFTKDGVEFPAVYEVGCIVCAPHLIDHPEGVAVKHKNGTKKVKRRSFSARALSPAAAVEKWNAGEYLEDEKIYWIPGYVPEYATETDK